MVNRCFRMYFICLNFPVIVNLHTHLDSLWFQVRYFPPSPPDLYMTRLDRSWILFVAERNTFSWIPHANLLKFLQEDKCFNDCVNLLERQTTTQAWLGRSVFIINWSKHICDTHLDTSTCLNERSVVIFDSISPLKRERKVDQPVQSHCRLLSSVSLLCRTSPGFISFMDNKAVLEVILLLLTDL